MTFLFTCFLLSPHHYLIVKCIIYYVTPGMKVYNTEEKELIMELGLKWAANPNILVAAKAFGLRATVQVYDLYDRSSNLKLE